MKRAKTDPMTADELYYQPDDDLRYELVRGQMVCEPPVGYRHGHVCMNLAVELGLYARTHGRRIAVVSEVGFILAKDPDTVRGPDLAVIESRRLAKLEDARKFVPGAPDLAIEVLSPRDTPARIRNKVCEYLDCGTRVVWIVDSERREVRVCKREGDTLLEANRFLVDHELLPGFAMQVRAIFD